MPPLLDHRGRPLPPSPRRDVRARFDAAVTDHENARHWANADGLSARSANSPEVRRVLRNRARYEVANNSYASGIVETLANDCIGTGPRLQVETADQDLNERLAESFEAWSAAVGLAELLRTFREARATDGEAFAVMTTNPRLPTPVRLDLLLVEADQVATPLLNPLDPLAVDGVELDALGKPLAYHVLPHHPGDLLSAFLYTAYRRVDAALVLHWFKRRRPGQYRGLPEITPALPLFAQMRRYTLATLSAAEIAALFAVLLKSAMPPDDDAAAIPPFDMQEVVRGMMTALPEGYDATQLKAEQPTTTYAQFKHELLNEVARAVNMPFNVAAGNSKDYNYASGRLDHQVYHRMIGVDRYSLETCVLDRVLAAWLAEARLADPGAVDGLPPGVPRHCWYWDGFAHVDPAKEASAQETRLRTGTATLADEWAAEGRDWRAQARQQKAERDYYAALGIPHPGDAPAPAPAPSGDPTQD